MSVHLQGVRHVTSSDFLIPSLACLSHGDTARVIQIRQIKTLNGILEEKIDLDKSIAPGIYLLKLSTENYSKVISFVKQ